ncbi:hypothetical protein B2J93_5589 [Marssonina coronariae]|uniref:Uncharacterized protein n=1 Tax=Diplocarpon coronariae TaxID=2795749 RepID=A0A218Z380_9HELO|nr:hypothetical protein B2J93_5589 [Marssonina coronariae]
MSTGTALEGGYQKVAPCPFAGQVLIAKDNPKKTKISRNRANTRTSRTYRNYLLKNEGQAILLVSDSRGLCYDSRLLADEFAGTGYLTVVPNYTGRIASIAHQEVYTPGDFKGFEGPLSLALGDEDDATPGQARVEIENYLMNGHGYPYPGLAVFNAL